MKMNPLKKVFLSAHAKQNLSILHGPNGKAAYQNAFAFWTCAGKASRSKHCRVLGRVHVHFDFYLLNCLKLMSHLLYLTCFRTYPIHSLNVFII